MSGYRNPSITARQRQSRCARMTRHSIFTMKRPIAFQVRKSLVEYVDMELAEMDTSVFYQRIFILAKNAHLTPEETEPESEPEPAQVDQSEAVPLTQPTLEFKEDMIIPMDDVSLSTEEAEEEASLELPSEVNRTSGDQDHEVLTHTFRFSGQETAEEEFVSEEEQQSTRVTGTGKPKDFCDIFIEVLEQLHKQCKEVAITPDPICGLYLYMGEYSLLMLEGSEDMVGCFTQALAKCCNTYWQTNRVFQIEDHITELYTKELIFRRLPAVYLNEKFPTSTPTDEYLMGKQHLIIKDKLHTICRMIWEGEQRETLETRGGSVYDSLEDEEDQTLAKSKSHLLSIDQMPMDIYRKHLPEIQRIDLVLASTRFYYELDGFSKLFGQVPFARDEEGHFWPIPNNYTPPNIFRRTPYDINLTFADYALAASKKRSMSLGSENSGGEEAAEEGAAKEEGADKEEEAAKEETPPKAE
ncbi:uncharacterized protein [Drosophila kikkawai]|uniref:Uncharacterized protein n=1 Tax=Drosophila kikkawai TaxID=30033 RepID=A0A6P4I3R8_DROKI|nr:uncharacterized protein LOC108075038 [Drosophila kikkawai]